MQGTVLSGLTFLDADTFRALASPSPGSGQRLARLDLTGLNTLDPAVIREIERLPHFIPITASGPIMQEIEAARSNAKSSIERSGKGGVGDR